MLWCDWRMLVLIWFISRAVDLLCMWTLSIHHGLMSGARLAVKFMLFQWSCLFKLKYLGGKRSKAWRGKCSSWCWLQLSGNARSLDSSSSSVGHGGSIPGHSRSVSSSWGQRVMERHGEHVALPQLPGSVVAAVAEANRQAARHRSGSSSSVDGMGYIWSARWAVGTAREWAIPLMGWGRPACLQVMGWLGLRGRGGSPHRRRRRDMVHMDPGLVRRFVWSVGCSLLSSDERSHARLGTGIKIYN